MERDAAETSRASASAVQTVSAPPVLALRDVTKSFGAVRALRGVTLELFAGAVVGLVGENGAGKSTLVKLMGGLLQPDTGQLEIDGQPHSLTSPQHAVSRGIAIVPQHPALFPSLSVAENIFVGRQPRGTAGLIDHRQMRDQAMQALDRFGVTLDVGREAGSLSIADQQLVGLMRALSGQARALILDEPTASLSGPEVDRLLAIVSELTSAGVAVAFISHRLDEVFAIANTITVLRDGAHVLTAPAADLDASRTISLMVGRDLGALYPKQSATIGANALSVNHLTNPGHFHDVTFDVRHGEILGFAGLVGAGRTEVAQALFGIDPAHSGTILIDDKPVTIHTPSDAMHHRIAYVPENRHEQGLVLNFGVATNTTLPQVRHLSRNGFLRHRDELTFATEHTTPLQLKAPDMTTPVAALSGGNQQKVVLAKWLATHPRVLILDEPTVGIDVGTKAEVHRLVSRLAADGVAVILISSELEEVLAMSDRVAVFREGRIVTLLTHDEATPELVMLAATGHANPAPISAGPEQADPPAPETHPETTIPTKSTTAHASRPATSRLRTTFGRSEAVLALTLLAVVGIVGATNTHFLTASTLRSVLLSAAVLVMVATGQALVVMTRNIDLSVGSTVGLSAFVTADVLTDTATTSLLLAIALAIAVGAAVGLINALLVNVGRVPSIVATLGTLALIRGIASLMANGRSIEAGQLPDHLLSLATDRVLGIPIPVLVAAVVVAVAAVTLRSTRTGRNFMTVGTAPEAAAVVGLSARRVTTIAFLCCGALAGLGGVFWTARYGSANATTASGFELQVIAAVVVGGVNIAGGRGTVGGVLIGCLLLATVSAALSVVDLPAFWLQAIGGAIIVIAVSVDAILRRRPTPSRAAVAS